MAEVEAPPVPVEEQPPVPAQEEAPPVAEEQPAAPAVVEQPPVVEKKPQQSFLSEGTEFSLAKTYLQSKVGVKYPVSLYDHLTRVVQHVLEQRPNNAVDQFEQLSYDIKRARPQLIVETAVQESFTSPANIERAKTLSKFLVVKTEEQAEGEQGDIPDILDLSNLWQWAGISFGQENTFVLFLSIKKLVEEKQLKSVRLWGRIQGLHKDYLIVEAELKDGVQDEEDAIVNKPLQRPDQDEKKKNLTRELRTGVNRYIYYTCNKIGDKWQRLPDVVPELLQVSRKIYKYFTGHLDQKINSYPHFWGTEADYLRCQIARISASTVLSPTGYYMPDGEDGGDEEGPQAIIVNPEFEGFANDQLANIANWCHHVQYILPQGRAVWENPQAKPEGEEQEQEEEEEEEQPEIEPEQGPQLLTPIANDEAHGTLPSWSAKLCSLLSPAKFSPVVLRSNRWPGAYTVAYNDKFANIYVGDGLKDIPSGHHVAPKLPEIQKEYVQPEGQELLQEQLDPTVEQEKQYEEEKAKENKEEDGEEAEEEEES
ncbi:radial spokehead-like protein [Gorgonomyces haynaldii]|nr:radial spokehead-like protein [Gorgonomyces haynaldii]